MNLLELVKYAIENRASDIHITVGVPPILRIDGSLIDIGKQIKAEDTKS